MLGLKRKEPNFKTTRLKRYLEYIKMRELLKRYMAGNSMMYGFCCVIIDVNRKIYIDKDRKERYPELWKRKPEINMDMGYWFPREDYAIRIKILDEIIEEIYGELNIFESAYLGFMEIFNVRHHGR